MSSLVRYPGPGCVVEFLHGNRTNVAWVLAEHSGRYRLLLANRRETKLPAARVLPWAGPVYSGEHSREEIVDILTRHDQEREALAAGVDPAELWELAQGDVPRASAQWFASLLWDDPGPDRVAAVGRRMLEQQSHFKFQPPDFDIHPREKVEARTAELEVQQRRERVVGAGQSLFRELWDCHVKGRPAPVFPAGRAGRWTPAQAARTARPPTRPRPCAPCSWPPWPRRPAPPRPPSGPPSRRACPRTRTCRCCWPRPGAWCPSTSTPCCWPKATPGATPGATPSPTTSPPRASGWRPWPASPNPSPTSAWTRRPPATSTTPFSSPAPRAEASACAWPWPARP